MSVYQNLPTATSDSSAVQNPNRAGRYLEAFTLPLGGGGLYSYANEGTLFTCCNATVGTGIAGHAAPVVADTDTKSLLHVFNSATNTKDIIPVALRLEFTAIGAGGTINYNVAYIDDGGVTARASGGTAITPVSAKSNANVTTGATVYFGAVVSSATTGSKVWAQQCREVIPVVTDTMTIIFGASGGNFQSGLTTASTATDHLVQYAPALSIGPGGNFKFVRTRASQSGADSYTFSFWYIER